MPDKDNKFVTMKLVWVDLNGVQHSEVLGKFRSKWCLWAAENPWLDTAKVRGSLSADFDTEVLSIKPKAEFVC